jgi:hypothetical protein
MIEYKMVIYYALDMLDPNSINNLMEDFLKESEASMSQMVELEKNKQALILNFAQAPNLEKTRKTFTVSAEKFKNLMEIMENNIQDEQEVFTQNQQKIMASVMNGMMAKMMEGVSMDKIMKEIPAQELEKIKAGNTFFYSEKTIGYLFGFFEKILNTDSINEDLFLDNLDAFLNKYFKDSAYIPMFKNEVLQLFFIFLYKKNKEQKTDIRNKTMKQLVLKYKL